MQRFLGTLTYAECYIPNLAGMRKPLLNSKKIIFGIGISLILNILRRLRKRLKPFLISIFQKKMTI